MLFDPAVEVTSPAKAGSLAVGRVPLDKLVAFKFVSWLPSTAGILALASNCKILFAVVPVSTAMVPLAVIAPPVSPVPAVMLVTVPVPVLSA